MQPEFMHFNHDGTQIFVNLQQNSALVRADVATATARAIDGYGLKPWTSGKGIDIVDDKSCDAYVTNPFLYSNRKPDGIATVKIDGSDYVLTADEGSDDDYGAYEEKREAGEVFSGTALGLRNFVAVSDDLFSTVNSTLGQTTMFNSECEANGYAVCADGLEITIGSDAVDFTDPSAPVLKRIVALGGRGIGLYQIPDSYDEEISFVWDSGSEFKEAGCRLFPWAHSGVQDEAFAPKGGTRYVLGDDDDQDELDDMNDPDMDGCEDAGNGEAGACPISATVDDKALEDGLAPESVTVGVACDRAFALSCGENNGDCFLYDISQIGNGEDPILVKTFNLSPASEKKSPGVAYEAESTIFVPANESPTGKAGIMFAGAHSGTISFWEFECETPVNAVETVFVGKAAVPPDDDDDDGGNSGVRFLAIIPVLVVVAGCAFFALKKKNEEKETDIEMVANEVIN